ALYSKHPVDLGTRCTVFMNSKVKQAQKEGATVSDISAGIAISVIKNALFKVIRVKDTAKLGKKIVVQGGTFYNDAVLRSLETILDCQVIRPDIAGLMGAYGIALLAKESSFKSSTHSQMLPLAELRNFHMTTTNYRCNICGNHCLITSLKFSGGRSYKTGNRCERGLGKPLPTATLPNLYAFKLKHVFNYKPLTPAEAPRGTIGIPRVLNIYEDYPFWFAFFTKLGYRVIISDASNHALYEKGLTSIPSDSLCYPAKMVHGHIYNLITKNIKKIFYPCIPYNINENPASDNHYNCPVVTSYAENIKANMKILTDQNITFLYPFLPLDSPPHLKKRLAEELVSENISTSEIADAVDLAYQELENYKKSVRLQGELALKQLKENKGIGIVLAGRPYHIDPQINHGIPELLQSYGLTVLSEDSIAHLAKQTAPLRVMDQWMYHSRLYKAASLVAETPELQLLQLNSFGCGLDAVTMDQVKELLDHKQKVYTSLKLDEINNLGAARIRIRSLLAALKLRKSKNNLMNNITHLWPTFKKNMKKTHTILAPQMSPVHFQFLQAALQKAGYNIVIPPLPDKKAVELGLKYVNNDICYPSIITIGQLLYALDSGDYDPNHTTIILFESGGGCRATNYVALMRKALKDYGMPQIPVFSLTGKDAGEFKISLSTMDRLLMAITYGDLLMKLMHQVRPYEKVPKSTTLLYDKWSEKCRFDLLNGNRWQFKNNIINMVKEFDELPLNTQIQKPKVGLVGEILVKYHSIANAHIVQTLEDEGAEVIVPDLINFFLYTAYDDVVKYKLLAGSLINKIRSAFFIYVIEQYRATLNKALLNSNNFSPQESFKDLVTMAKSHISLGNITGEGWLLTAEMVSLIKSGINNIICLQPFGCLPNHIVGKGMIREILHHYPDANIVPIDCDAGASEVNQLNRIKLMLSVALKKMQQKH
ncbi:MAG TPA: 2-hydroxyacyl-CoA dehydratase, partial [Candidatus Avacidaminococcus intestinavium]|nr:2-hydroxyacyl-CoA dehydratase [Candidatus Avacidaminococcus intestinavium]